ncbi:GSCOCG00011117001-RA-CDS, partial [Cotesia congregata]
LISGWLCKAPASLISAGRGEAYCKFCRVSLRAQKHDLTKHVKTQMHIKNMESLNVKKQATLLSIGTANVNEALKLAEIKLVLNNAAHGSLKNIDHLCEMLKDIGKGSQLSKLRLHRTKCSKIILNVIAPGMLKELLDDLGEESYSILLDESTDVSTMKYMAYCIRYYSKKQKKIVTDFLGFNEVNEATAEKLFSDFEKFMNGLGLNINNLVGLGTDGASNLCGVNHSLYVLLKKKYPQVQLLKCSCHSLNLVAAKASEQLPSNIEFLFKIQGIGLRIVHYA